MRCTTLYSIAATALLAITVQAAPAPTGVLQRPGPAPSGVFRRQEAEPSGVFQKREAVPSGVFQKRNPAPSGVFVKRDPAPSGVFQRRDGATPTDPPYPQRNADSEEPATTASCSSTDDKAPLYTVTVPAEIASMEAFGEGCPAQGFIDLMREGGDPLFGFGCKTNADGGVTLIFSSSGQIGNAIDLALAAVSDYKFPEEARCQEA